MSRPKVSANLSMRVWADCPKCKEQLDLLDVDELIEDSSIYQLINDKDHWKSIGWEFDCPKCGAELEFDSLEN